MGLVIDESKEQSDKINMDARAGQDSLHNMNSSMQKAGESSHEMQNIVGMISDISDQINLFSLNAAIESARAGDAGKGFAVVSDQISKLAEETANSIGEINTLIKENSSEIEAGSPFLISSRGGTSRTLPFFH